MSLSVLELRNRAEDAQAHLSDCRLCPHRCGVARVNANGSCRVGQAAYVASEMIHMGEESVLRPAHAIFFSGCTATCSFCTAARFAFRPTYGVVPTPAQLAARIAARQDEGVRSICFIGGDPVPHIPFILATLADLGDRKRVPSVLNSNFYLSHEAVDLLRAVIDIYLPDLKFGPAGVGGDCGAEIGGMENYWQVVTRTIERLIAGGEQVIVRHLLMPGHFDCCTVPIFHWLAGRPTVQVSLLTQYVAPAHRRGNLARRLTPGQVLQAKSLARELSLSLLE